METDTRLDLKRGADSCWVGIRLSLNLEAKPKLCKTGIKQLTAMNI